MTSVDLTPLRTASQLIEAARVAGWALEDDSFVARATCSSATPIDDLRMWDAVASAIIDASATTKIAGESLTLTRSTNGSVEVSAVPSFGPEAEFKYDKAEYAEAAWNGDAAAAQSLGRSWDVAVHLDLGRLIDPQEVDLRVSLHAATITQAFAVSTIETVSRLIPSSGRRLYISLDGSEPRLNTGAVSIVCLFVEGAAIELSERAADLPGESAAILQRPIPTPTSLAPADSIGGWSGVREALARVTSAATWVFLADRAADGAVEYFGFKRVHFDLPGAWTQSMIDATARLRLWAFAEESPDRILALRQVISLYDAPGPFTSADEVRQSAEPIYRGLRSSAVAEVVRASREAREQALTAVRQSIDTSQALMKSTVERAIAGSVGIGAAVIAHVSASVPADVTNWLLLGVAGFFLLLLCLFEVVESPTMSLPIAFLDKDLSPGLNLLSAEERTDITEGKAVQAVKVRILVVRIAVAAVYALLALGTLSLVASRVIH